MTYTITISGDFWAYYNPGMITKHAGNESRSIPCGSGYILDLLVIIFTSDLLLV